MNTMGRRAALGLGAGLAVAGTAAACSSQHSTGSNIGQNVGTINDLTVQQAELTIQAYNHVQKDPYCQYPAALLTTSLELRNQRERLLRFNEPTKLGWVYLISQGNVLAEIPVMGKVSSCQSSMTASDGVYTTNDSGGVAVPLPGDDISFGPSEGGDRGTFFFTLDGVMIQMTTDWIYSDAKLTLLDKQVLRYEAGSTPSSKAPKPKAGDNIPLSSPSPAATITQD